MIRFAAVLLVLALAGSAQATTLVMTFDGVPNYGAFVHSWTEDGITATSGHIAYADTLGTVHLDTEGTTEFSGSIDLTTGSLFAPTSIDVIGLSSGYCLDGTLGRCVSTPGVPFPYIQVVGYLGGGAVGSVAFYASGPQTLLLDGLPIVDLLRVRVQPFYELGLPGGCDIGAGCGHFDLDKVVLNAIPEPSELALLIAAILMVARRKRPASEETGRRTRSAFRFV